VTAPKGRNTFGDESVDRLLTELLAQVGLDANDDLVRRLLVTTLDMDADDVDRLELKIASQSLVEMHNAWKVFSPYRDRSKVTVFGSARTAPDHPDYAITQAFSERMARKDWMIISGAGPGVMTAAIEGAGVENSFGVNIVLPFEQRAAEIIDGDPKLATFRYFFTRKLFFMKESDAFALAPGGFGTLDESFELLTLIQTGKSAPAPIVLLDHPGSNYWNSWERFVEEGLGGGGMINEADTSLYLHTHDPDEAVEYICHYYSCFHSLRYVGKRLVLRLRRALGPAAIDQLNTEFGDMVVEGTIDAIEVTDTERRDGDVPELPRIAFRFDNRSFARLNQLILRVNDLGGVEVASSPGPMHELEPESDDSI
jgi:uncharacterized protein (TIGR00730 family)